jgi:hypothetical protein
LNDEHELGSQALRRLDECVFHAFTTGDFEPFLDLCDPNTVVSGCTMISVLDHHIINCFWPMCILARMASCLLLQLFSRSAADGETILMAAALHARLDLVQLFLDVGAYPWTETLGRYSPPMNAASFAKVLWLLHAVSFLQLIYPTLVFRCIRILKYQGRLLHKS